MTAPAATARTTPTGTMLENGYQSLIAFSTDPDCDIWEKSVQPPGIDGGDSIDITTQHNTTWKTKAAQALADMSDGQITGGYDPKALSQILALCNTSQVITVHFPDGSTWAFFGYLKSFVPNGNENGVMPEATCTFVVTNTDPATGEEEAPVYAVPAA